METIDISEWTRRRAGAALGAVFQTAANFIPAPVVFTSGQGLTVKGTLVGLVVTLPKKPSFAELDVLPGRTGFVLDIFENAIVGTDDLQIQSRTWFADIKRWLPVTPNGTVIVMPAFFGRDP